MEYLGFWEIGYFFEVRRNWGFEEYRFE